MATEKIVKEEKGCKKNWKSNGGGPQGAIYGFGLIGALVYFIQHATSFPDGLLGILKAIVWPALVVYNLLGYLKI